MSHFQEQKYPPVRFGDKHYFVMDADTSVTYGRFTDLQGNPVPIPDGLLCYDIVAGARRPVVATEGVWPFHHLNDMNHQHIYEIYIEGSEAQGPVLALRPRTDVTFLSPTTVKRNDGK
jgi:hypothetical protein